MTSTKSILRKISTSKGQTSLEFFLLFGVSTAILAFTFGAIEQKQSEVFERQNNEIGTQVAENVGFQAEMALAQGKGYSREFFLPREIAGEYYNVTVRNRIVYVGWGENFVTNPTLYAGTTLDISTESTNKFKILHDEAGVEIIER